METFRTYNIFGQQTFCCVTGASKGFGQALAVKFADKFPKGSVLLLTARSRDGLEKTRAIIQSKSPHITVVIAPKDLAECSHEDFDRLLKDTFTELGRGPGSFDQCVLVHNAASLGDVSKLFSEQNNDKHLAQYWRLNLSSFTILNHVFFQHFTKETMQQRVVIGISSICALQPFKSWSLYCAGKAARDMLLRTMALEDPSIRILNYAPGPIDTEMQLLARTLTADDELRLMFKDFKDNDKLLSCDESLSKLLPLLEKNSFDSGAHIDYYDI